MKRFTYLFLGLAVLLMAADLPAYKLYSAKGKEIKFSKMMKELEEADIILFGELHNNPIAHWMQLKVAETLVEKQGEKLVFGAEMFESDNQLIIDEYFAGYIKERHFEKECRLWNNYKTDYKPLLNLAKSNELKFIATNVPRRYASLVAGKGRDGLNDLSDEAKKYLCKLPYDCDSTLPSYAALKSMSMGGHGNSENFMYAQAIKDATMARFILENWKKGQQFLHFNGAYHSDSKEGIAYYLKKANPNLNIKNITCVEKDNVDEINDEEKAKADYILAIPSKMTKTY